MDPKRFENVPMVENQVVQTLMRSVTKDDYQDPVYFSTTESIRFRAYGDNPTYWPDKEELPGKEDALPLPASILLNFAVAATNAILSGNRLYSRDFEYDEETYAPFLEVGLNVTTDEKMLEEIFLKYCGRIIQARRELVSDICLKLGSLE